MLPCRSDYIFICFTITNAKLSWVSVQSLANCLEISSKIFILCPASKFYTIP